MWGNNSTTCKSKTCAAPIFTRNTFVLSLMRWWWQEDWMSLSWKGLSEIQPAPGCVYTLIICVCARVCVIATDFPHSILNKCTCSSFLQPHQHLHRIHLLPDPSASRRRVKIKGSNSSRGWRMIRKRKQFTRPALPRTRPTGFYHTKPRMLCLSAMLFLNLHLSNAVSSLVWWICWLFCKFLFRQKSRILQIVNVWDSPAESLLSPARCCEGGGAKVLFCTQL